MIPQAPIRVQMHRKTTVSELRKMRIQAPNTLTASALQEFQRQYQRFRCSVEMKHARMQTRPAGTSGKGSTERHHKPPHASEPEQKPQKPHPMHLNLNKNRKSHHNVLNNFQLQRFAKNSTAFRCSEKQEHLNLDKIRIQAPNAFTTRGLHDFQQQYPRFRCSVEMKQP